MNENIKELEGQVIKEFEDEKWVAVRPLTFSASSKYGSSTRWCTTYQREKNYFEKYWRKGILVYFINKQTGYKFAGYKGLDGDSEFSFWNAEDSRIDYLDVNADDYLFPIVRRIFKSEMTNKNLSSDEIQEQVHSECILSYEKMRIQFRGDEMDGPVEIQQPTEESQEMDINEMRERLVEATRETHNNVRELRAEVSYSEDVPTMSA
jgi:hypothetical protein